MRNHLPRLRGVSAASLAALGAAILSFAGPAAAAGTVVYRIDPGKSKLTARASETGLVNETRTLEARTVAGQAVFTRGALKPTSLQLTIKANSFKSIGGLSAGDREKIETSVREPILEAQKYPVIVFKSTKILGSKNAHGQYQARILGNLTLHGVTQPVIFNAQGTLTGDSLTARGEIPLKQTDYNITLLSLLGGAISVKDEMTVAFDVTARRAK